MTRDEKIAKAKRLRELGLSYEEVGRRLGVTGGCVQKWLKPEAAKRWAANDRTPERNARKRAWENDHDRPLCACGNRMGVGAHRKGYFRCKECRRAADAERTAIRGREIVAMWAAGMTMREIQARYGWTKGHLAQQLHRLRAKGFDLPKRPPGGLRLQHAQQAQHNQDQDHEQEDEQDLRHRDHAEAVGNLEKGL
jgi:transposase